MHIGYIRFTDINSEVTEHVYIASYLNLKTVQTNRFSITGILVCLLHTLDSTTPEALCPACYHFSMYKILLHPLHYSYDRI